MGDFTKKIGRELLDLYINGPVLNSHLLLQNDDDEDESDLGLKAPKRISNKKANAPLIPSTGSFLFYITIIDSVKLRHVIILKKLNRKMWNFPVNQKLQ